MSGEKKFILGTALLSILVFVIIILSANDQNEELSKPLAGEEQPNQGAAHIPRGALAQKQDPPTSGSHYGDGVAGPGIHDEPVDDGLTLHSMEHGAVVLHYDPEKLSGEQIEQLKDIFLSKLRGKKIMMPRTNMSKPIIMTSWGQILSLDEIKEDELINFIEINNDRGLEKSSTY